MRAFVISLLILSFLSGCASQATFGDAITLGEPTPIPTPIVPSKPVYQVERGNIIFERRFYGRISPLVTEEIAFAIDGRIDEIYVERGADVAQGDVLARLNTRALENQLLAAEEALGDCPIDPGERRESDRLTRASARGSHWKWRSCAWITPARMLRSR